MKIQKITNDYIAFDNGKRITFNHDFDCCENNYADFSVLNENTVNIDYDFDENSMIFRFIEEEGFVFGNESHMIFVPCYSSQNGYYTTEIDIYFDGEIVASGGAREDFY